MHKALFLPLQLSLSTFSCLYTSPILAQITPDGTVNTEVNQNGNVSEITGGETRGDNLFHSFEDFSVGTGNEAAFLNGNDISNIFSRVTGGNISNIDGLIRANGSASLFLINPNGIIFGENARLDIGGSFYGSSASSILFEDGEFSAVDNLEQPLLTVNAPIGLNFRDDPGDITVRGDGNGARLVDSEVIDTEDALRVGADATIGFIGGNVLFEDATVKTPGGRIEIGSVSSGIVGLIAVDNGFTFDYSAIETFQDIFLSGNSNIDGSGLGGGDINVVGNNISLTGVSAIVAITLGDQVGGDINVFAADSIEISGVENELNFVSGIFNRTFPNGTASAGDININTGSLSIGDRGSISTIVSGEGNAGNININASDAVTLASQGNTSRIFSGVNAGAVGNAGNIDITSSSLTISDQASLNATSAGDGNAGNVTVNASDAITLEDNNSNPSASNTTSIRTFVSGDMAQGDAGDIELSTGSLTLNNGGLFASNTSLGSAGNIIINASENVSLTNSANLNVFGAGGGSVTINARNLSLTTGSNIFSGINIDVVTDNAQAGNITINTSEDILIDAAGGESTNIVNNNFGIGNPGDLELNARNISLINGGAISSFNTGQGSTGNILVNATEDIVFDGISAGIGGITSFSDAESSGTVGNIDLQAQNLIITNGAGVSSQVAGEITTGDININVDDTISIDGSAETNIDNTSSFQVSTISNIVSQDGIGNAGNININTNNLFLSRNGDISASTQGLGNAGNIDIKANLITIGEQGNPNIAPSSIQAQTFADAQGNGGNITIDTGSLLISDGGDIDVGIFGTGNGGNINITARDLVSVDGTGLADDIQVSSGILADAFNSVGNAGDIEIDTTELSVTNGAFVSADVLGESTGNGGSINLQASESVKVSGGGAIQAELSLESTGTGGNLSIDTRRLTVEDGAEISVITFGEGNAGSLTITATESIQLSGTTEISRGGIFASALENNGNGGDINLATGDLTISDGAIITASNFSSLGVENGGAVPGSGEPGDITITANSISLSEQGSIQTATQFATGEGANITLQVEDNLTLQDEGLISAQAFNQGNGGNLSIDSGFIIAFPSNGNGNDIIANAEEGNGGNINLNATLLGIEEGFAAPGNDTNDIDASSQFSLDGNVTINNPDNNLIQGATDLPSNIIQAEQTTTAQSCRADGSSTTQNGLTIAGKGGVQAAPDLPLNSLNVTVDGEINPSSAIPEPINTSKGKIQPARGIKVTESGEISLVAYHTNNAGDRISPNTQNCGQI